MFIVNHAGFKVPVGSHSIILDIELVKEYIVNFGIAWIRLDSD